MNISTHTTIPTSVIEAIDRLATASYKLGEASQDVRPQAIARLQQHEDEMYNNLLTEINNKLLTPIQI